MRVGCDGYLGRGAGTVKGEGKGAQRWAGPVADQPRASRPASVPEKGAMIQPSGGNRPRAGATSSADPAAEIAALTGRELSRRKARGIGVEHRDLLPGNCVATLRRR